MHATPAATPAGDFDRFLRHCARFWLIAPKTYPRGVRRFRDVTEAHAARSRHGLEQPDSSG
jgi:hypothetical protein